MNIILIGMPGAGKSTIGVILAKALGMDFLDTDLCICKQTGKTLQQILDSDGLDAFLQIEEDVVCGLSPENTVIATGGSVPMRKKAMRHMRSLGTIIYLKVELSELSQRLSNIKTRGIAFGPGENLQTLYEKRVPVYEAWADKTVTADPRHNNIEHMAEAIISALTC